MNDHIDESFSDEELSEAFDLDAPEPTDEHIEQIRGQILRHTSSSLLSRQTTVGTGEPKIARRHRVRIPLSLASVSAVVLVALLLARPFVKDAAAGLQDSLKATRQALWIHGSTTIKHGDKTVVAESWCSPAERIVALRSPQMLHFVDYEKGMQSSYMEQHEKIFQWRTEPSAEGFGRQFVYALLNDQDLELSFPLHEVSEVAKTEIDAGGQSRTEYSFHVQMEKHPEVRWETSIQTAPSSGRIVLWQDHHANGMQVTVEFDYPDDGPGDIFELGAPPTAEVVNIATPESDLFGKQRFDQVDHASD